MSDLPAWIAAAIGLVALVLAYLTYRSQRGKVQIEYAVLANAKILPGRVARALEVRHGQAVMREPSLAILRLVNTGDRPIKPADFETDLIVTFEGISGLQSATWTGSRPPDLRPDIHIDGGAVRIAPTLINPEDMLELQVLSEGQARAVTVAGRIAGLRLIPRKGLPYPPGSGREGRMVGMDQFMWFVFSPGVIVAVGVVFAASGDNMTPTGRVLTLLATAILAGVLYPLHVWRLVRRRRLWRA